MNLVKEIVDYVVALERFISEENFSVITQAFITLTEMMQGPCLGNKIAVTQSKIYVVVNRLLVFSSDSMLSNVDFLELQKQAAITARTVMEGEYFPSGIQMLRDSLDVLHMVTHGIHAQSESYSNSWIGVSYGKAAEDFGCVNACDIPVRW